MVEKKIIWVFILVIVEVLFVDMFWECKFRVKRVYDYGVCLVVGGDIGMFSYGFNVWEVEIMI